jgi:hypothetical protein
MASLYSTKVTASGGLHGSIRSECLPRGEAGAFIAERNAAPEGCHSTASPTCIPACRHLQESVRQMRGTAQPGLPC